MEPPAQRKVTLSKADRETPAGRELITLLAELSDDGQVTREELARLRAWLEVDRGVDFPACAFLYELIDTISADGEITEEELDRIALAIERVLPKDVRAAAAAKRKALRTARRVERKAARDSERAQIREARELARPLHRADFMVAGARRSSERRQACECLRPDETVILEREPDNRHDRNAILVLANDGSELGYVPREYAKEMAPLLDDGAEVDAVVKKLWSGYDGRLIPVVISTLYRRGFRPPVATITPTAKTSDERRVQHAEADDERRVQFTESRLQQAVAMDHGVSPRPPRAGRSGLLIVILLIAAVIALTAGVIGVIAYFAQ